jgi:hypothetical protein
MRRVFEVLLFDQPAGVSLQNTECLPVGIWAGGHPDFCRAQWIAVEAKG